VTGTLGAGKTAFTVEQMYDHLCRGGWVFTNVEVFHDEKHPHPMALRDNFKQRMAKDGYVFQPERLVVLTGNARTFHEHIKRGTANCVVLLVIDEAGLDLNSRDWAQTEKPQLAFNTMARKLDIRLLYITQDANDVDKQIRRKADTIYVCRNLKNLRILGVVPIPIPLYIRVRFDNTRGDKPRKMDFDLAFKSKAWGLYNSDAMVGSSATQFANMQTVDAAPLERIRAKVVAKRRRAAILFAAFSSCVTYYLCS